MHTYLGKYREIVLAVACFLVFDLAVLMLNFYISFQISESAVAINLAGRQRMLSQRMTKELLEVQDDQAQARDIAPAVARLQKSVELFDRTLAGFREGGMVPGGDGKPVPLAPVASASGQVILAQAEALWRPFRGMVPEGGRNAAVLLEVDAAARYARTYNTELLALMNRLTTDLEQAASARANTLRLVQTAGILLALLNFAFILFKFIRRLQDNDRRIEAAQAETAEILGTVKEGLFLLDHDLRIGSQHSASLPQMLGTAIAAGSDFRAILQRLLPADSVKTAVEYIGLLLGDRVKEALVQDLNPLLAVPVSISDEHGLTQRRYLTLQFNRVLIDGRISHLLVTVFDVTAQVELEQALTETRARAKAEVEVMLDLLKVNPATLRHFLDRAEHSLLQINDLLRHASNDGRDYRRSLGLMFRLVHMLKGEAAALGLAMFEELAQRFEELLAGLRSRGSVSGADLLALPLPLDEFLQRIASVRELGHRLAAYQSAFPGSHSDATLLARMRELAQRIARDHGKQVQVEADLTLLQQLPTAQRDHLQDIALQLLRNAVVHGIEPEQARQERKKPARGTISMSLRQVDNEYEFVLRDDGQGLVPERIAAALVSRGLYTQEQTAELGERQLIMKIFEPGVSTALAGGRDAGQGVGLDVVRHKLQNLGARLQVSSRRDEFTQFRIRFAF
jgi:HPt (histidine-containing phosphotransfer) domain-containing protein